MKLACLVFSLLSACTIGCESQDVFSRNLKISKMTLCRHSAPNFEVLISRQDANAIQKSVLNLKDCHIDCAGSKQIACVFDLLYGNGEEFVQKPATLIFFSDAIYLSLTYRFDFSEEEYFTVRLDKIVSGKLISELRTLVSSDIELGESPKEEH